MTNLDAAIIRQAKEKREKLKEIKKILDEALHKINNINDKNFSCTGPKEDVRLRLYNIICDLTNEKR